MKRFDYDFSEYNKQANGIIRKILSESYEGFDVEEVSGQIDEAQVTYNKIRKILNCPEMIKSHAYLYALDMENVDECDKAKVDKLYDLGIARGVIEPDEEKPEDDDSGDFDACGDEICGGPQDALTGQEMVPGEITPPKTSSAFTVLYSAMKDGQVKTGEFFSSATDQDSAKTDCVTNLAPLGYSNIRVLGIEQTNDAVDFGTQTLDGLDEDDSKEYEAQETGDTSSDDGADAAEKPEENTPKQEKPEEKKSEDKPEEKPDEEKPEDDAKEPEKKDDGAKPEEKKEPEPEKKDDEPQDGEEEGKKELSAAEKQVLKDEYVGMFKSELQATGLQKSVNDMTIKEKADFWGKIAEKWTKQDPEDFMSAKEIEKLCDTVIKVS